MKYPSKGIKPLCIVVCLMTLELWLNCENINIIKEVTRDKCIPLRIKDDNVPLKFVFLVENATLKDHSSYKNGLENIEL